MDPEVNRLRRALLACWEDLRRLRPHLSEGREPELGEVYARGEAEILELLYHFGAGSDGSAVAFDLPAAIPIPSPPPYHVRLTYFKAHGGPANLGGKYYSEGAYVTAREHSWEVLDEVENFIRDGRLPGLSEGLSEFHVLVEVPLHPHRVSYLFPAGGAR